MLEYIHNFVKFITYQICKLVNKKPVSYFFPVRLLITRCVVHDVVVDVVVMIVSSALCELRNV